MCMVEPEVLSLGGRVFAAKVGTHNNAGVSGGAQ